jgi:hypothetical protein
MRAVARWESERQRVSAVGISYRKSGSSLVPEGGETDARVRHQLGVDLQVAIVPQAGDQRVGGLA